MDHLFKNLKEIFMKDLIRLMELVAVVFLAVLPIWGFVYLAINNEAVKAGIRLLNSPF
jgi:hypothetical protein